MLEIYRNIGTIPIYSNISFDIDITNNSSMDMTVIDITSDYNVNIFDIAGTIVPSRSILRIGGILKSIPESYDFNQNKKIYLKTLFDNTNEDIVVNIDFTTIVHDNTLLFKINDKFYTRKYLIVTIEYDYTNIEAFQQIPILILWKLNNSIVKIYPKINKINVYTYSYLFDIDKTFITVNDNLFLLYYKDSIKIRNIDIRSL